MTLKDWLSVVSTTVTIITVVFTPLSIFVYRRVIRPLAQLPEFMSKIEVITKELTTNGGSSLKDKVIATSRDVKLILSRSLAVTQLDPRPIFEMDRHGLCTWVNKSYLKLVGLSIGDVLGHGWKNILHSDDLHRIAEGWASAVSERREFVTTFRIVNANGLNKEVIWRAIPMSADQDVILGYIGYMMQRDRSAREAGQPVDINLISTLSDELEILSDWVQKG